MLPVYIYAGTCPTAEYCTHLKLSFNLNTNTNADLAIVDTIRTKFPADVAIEFVQPDALLDFPQSVV